MVGSNNSPWTIDAKTLIEGDLFELLGLNNLSDEQQEEVMRKLIEGLESRVMLRIADLIPETDQEAWEHVLASSDDQLIRNYLDDLGINVGQLVAEESLRMKHELLVTVKG